MKQVQKMSRLLAMPLLAALVIFAAGCGGGGGTPSVSFPTTTATITGTIANLTADSDNLARLAPGAERSAAAATTISDFSGFTVVANGVTGSISGNKYTITGVAAGANILVKITKGAIILKAYVPSATAGKSHSKNISVTTTAAAEVWESMGKPSSTSVESLETTASVIALVAVINAAIQDDTLVGDADSVLEAATVKTQVETAVSSGDETAPTISSIYPNGDATKVTLDTTVVKIVFNEAMTTTVPTGISVVLVDTTNSNATTTVAAPTVSWGADGKTLTIDHGTTLTQLAEYTLEVTLDPTEFSDAAATPNAMTALPSTIHGATVDKTAKTITVEFKTTGYYEVEEATQNEFDDIGATETTFITKFSGGTTIASSGATYAGTDACQTCHASKYVYYKQTNHYTAYERKLLGYFKSTCIYCHSVDGPRVPDYSAGIDAPSRTALNGAFGLVATDYTTVDINDTPAAMRSIQCENCHGPASLHIAGDGDTDMIVGGDDAMASSTCAVCHDAPTHHVFVPQWREGAHSTSSHSGASCSPCHNGDGFLEMLERQEADSTVRTYDGEGTISSPVYNINCATCHDPHQENEGAEHQLRMPEEELCRNCHYTRGRTPGSSTHYSVQGSVLEGWGGMTFEGKMYWSATSGETAPDGVTTTTAYGPSMDPLPKCVDCHMYDAGHGPDHSLTVHPESCAQTGCHPTMSDPGAVIGDKQASFILKYDAVKARLDDAIDVLDQNADGKLNTSDVGDGLLTQAEYDMYNNAKWNLDMVYRDHSKGVHNTAYVNKLMDEAGKMLTELGVD